MVKSKKVKDKPVTQTPIPSVHQTQPYSLSDEPPPVARTSPVLGESWYSQPQGTGMMNSPISRAPSAHPGSPLAGSGAFQSMDINPMMNAQTMTGVRASDVPPAAFGWGTPSAAGAGSVMGGTPNIGSDWGGKQTPKDRERKVKFGETSAAPSPAGGSAWGPAPHDKWDQASASTDSRWEDGYGQADGPNEWGHYEQHQTSYRAAPPPPPQYSGHRAAPKPPPQPVAGPSKPPAWQTWAKENKPTNPTYPSPPSIHPPPSVGRNQSWQSWASEAQKLQKTASSHSSAKHPPRLNDTLGDLLNHGTPNTQSRYLGNLTKAQQEQLQRYAQDNGFRTNPLLKPAAPSRQSSHRNDAWGQQAPSASWGAPNSNGGWGANDDYEEDEDWEEDDDEWGNDEWDKGNGNGYGWGTSAARKDGKSDPWSAKGDAWDAKGEVWKGDGNGWGVQGAMHDSGWGGETQKQDPNQKPKQGQYKGWGDEWDIVEEDEYDDDGYSSRSPRTPGKSNPSLLTQSVGFGTINGDNYPMPSKTLAHAYTLAGTPLPKSDQLPTEIVETKGAGLAPAEHAFFDTKSRFARDRLHWMFPPHKDKRVANVMGQIQKDAYNVGVFGLRKFLQTRERGALLVNASITPSSPNVLAFDWLTFDQLQQTRDRILQQSVAYYDPAVKTIVFIFLPSRTGNSVAIWRRKVVVPNNVRLMYQPELQDAIAGLRAKKEYVVHIDELPSPKSPEKPPEKPAKKSLKRKNSLKREILGPDGKPVKQKKKRWWKRFFGL